MANGVASLLNTCRGDTAAASRIPNACCRPEDIHVLDNAGGSPLHHAASQDISCDVLKLREAVSVVTAARARCPPSPCCWIQVSAQDRGCQDEVSCGSRC